MFFLSIAGQRHVGSSASQAQRLAEQPLQGLERNGRRLWRRHQAGATAVRLEQQQVGGGVHHGAHLRVENEVGGQELGAALPDARVVAGRVPQKDGGFGARADRLASPHHPARGEDEGPAGEHEGLPSFHDLALP